MPPAATRLFWGSGASAAFLQDSVPLVVFLADSQNRPIGSPRPSVTWESSDNAVFRILNDTLGEALDTGSVVLTARMPGAPGFALDVFLLILPRPDWRMAWVRSRADGVDPRIVWQDLSSQEIHVVPEFSYPDAGHGHGRITADRSRMVVYAARPVSPLANHALYVIDLPTGTSRILLDTMAGQQIWPVWLPGDTSLVFLADRSGWWEVWTVGLDGSNPTRRTNLRQYYPPFFDVTPEGNLILELGPPEQRPNGRDLYELTLDGDTVRRITSTPTLEPREAAVSPDGATIAFSRDTISDIWLMDRTGANIRRFISGRGVVQLVDGRASENVSHPMFPSWSPDGHFILVQWTADPDERGWYYALLPEIYAIRVSDGRAVRLTHWPPIDAQATAR